jgi:hypothetical protein
MAATPYAATVSCPTRAEGIVLPAPTRTRLRTHFQHCHSK